MTTGDQVLSTDFQKDETITFKSGVCKHLYINKMPRVELAGLYRYNHE